MNHRFWLNGAAAGFILAGAGAGCALAQTAPPPAPETDSITQAIAAGHLLLDLRGRYEFVDQAKSATIKDNAAAYTLRTQLGWETAAWYGFKGLLEFQDVTHIGPEDYAVNAPGATTPPLNGASKAKYPLINDPDEVELNRLQLSWTYSPDLSMTAGRQRILIDDQRFVGDVGWRQDEQTFDGGRLDAGYGGLRITYAYLNRVNRVLGPSSDWDSDSHLLNASYTVAPPLKLEGFVYALDFANSQINNSITEGGKVSGKANLGTVQLVYNGTYADQTGYHSGSTPHFDLGYYDVDAAAIYGPLTGKAGYEVLEGNGVRGFTTPLATTHAFNGWADAWVSPGGNKSFVDGIKDLNLTAAVRPPVKCQYFFNPELTFVYHDFDDEKTGAYLADEYDFQATAQITAKLSILAKYADFIRAGSVPAGTAAPPPSRQKVWFSFEYKL
jgi:hypothetical protein